MGMGVSKDTSKRPFQILQKIVYRNIIECEIEYHSLGITDYFNKSLTVMLEIETSFV